MDTPKTMEEWTAYIGELTGPALYSKALAANSVTFVRMLENEGYTPEQIEHILTMFAEQFEVDDQTVPSNGSYIDFNALLAPIPVPTP